MLLRLVKAMWCMFETQTKVVLRVHTNKIHGRIPEETVAMQWAATPLPSKVTALLSRAWANKVVLFLLGYLPSGVYDME